MMMMMMHVQCSLSIALIDRLRGFDPIQSHHIPSAAMSMSISISRLQHYDDPLRLKCALLFTRDGYTYVHTSISPDSPGRREEKTREEEEERKDRKDPQTFAYLPSPFFPFIFLNLERDERREGKKVFG